MYIAICDCRQVDKKARELAALSSGVPRTEEIEKREREYQDEREKRKKKAR
jgi:hypothetical protein